MTLIHKAQLEHNPIRRLRVIDKKLEWMLSLTVQDCTVSLGNNALKVEMPGYPFPIIPSSGCENLRRSWLHLSLTVMDPGSLPSPCAYARPEAWLLVRPTRLCPAHGWEVVGPGSMTTCNGEKESKR
jgi:hypothetical protein